MPKKKTTRICTSISARSPGEMAKKASLALSLGTDLVEFRVDRLSRGVSTRQLQEELSRFARRAVFTVRASGEGGSFGGREGERLELLTGLAELGPAYLDIELSTAKANEGWVKSLPERVERIVSWHDFLGTPPLASLEAIYKEERSYGALSKIVTMATSADDNLTALALYEDHPEKTISFCMGELGTISRVMSMRMRAPLAYAALPGEAVAQGQLSISIMRRLRSMVE